MTEKPQLRYARKPITSTCMLKKGINTWLLKIVNISASGLFLSTEGVPSLKLKLNDKCKLEVKIDEEKPLILEVEVTRIADDGYGFRFINFPLEKQIPLWELLGAHVDKIEK